mgnify:FL=1
MEVSKDEMIEDHQQKWGDRDAKLANFFGILDVTQESTRKVMSWWNRQNNG